MRKFKKTKEQSKSKFPNISRFITEKWVFLVSLLLLVILLYVSFLTYKVWQIKEKAVAERQKVIKELQFWEKIVREYPNYRDAYFKLALLSYRLKDYEKAKIYLQKTFSMDPNFEKGKEMERMLSGK